MKAGERRTRSTLEAMRSKLLVVVLAAVTSCLAACGSGSSTTTAHSAQSRASSISHARPTKLYRVSLSGGAETPPGAPSGRGAAVIAFHGDSRVCWRFAHLHGFTDATLATIYAGSKGQAGTVVVPLSTGPRLRHQGCVPISAALSRTIWSDPSRYYVSIHSLQYPHGAIRAQL